MDPFSNGSTAVFSFRTRGGDAVAPAASIVFWCFRFEGFPYATRHRCHKFRDSSLIKHPDSRGR